MAEALAQSSPAAGPADPTWLARLSARLGVHAAKSLSPALLAIWPGVSVTAVCCREAAAHLMQMQGDAVTFAGLEAAVRHAVHRRGMQMTPSADFLAIMEGDASFVIDWESAEQLVR